MSATMSCKRCGGSITSDSVAEVVKWDVSHDEVCPADPRNTEATA